MEEEVITNPLQQAQQVQVSDVQQGAMTNVPVQATTSPPVGTVDSNEVYSPTNIVQATSSPAPAPNYEDPYGMYDQFMNSPEIAAAKAEVEAIQNQINQLNANVRTSLAGYNNSPMSMNAIRGAQSATVANAALPLQALAEQLGTKQTSLSSLLSTASDRYNIAREERGKLEDLIKATGGDAGIKYTDSYKDAVKKADKYLEKKAKKDAVKQLYFQTFGSWGKGKSTKDMEKKLKKYFKNNKDYEDRMNALKERELEASIANTYSLINDRSSGGSGGSDEDLKSSYTETEQARMIEEALAGGDNWHDINQTFRAIGIPTDGGSYMDNYLKKRFGYE